MLLKRSFPEEKTKKEPDEDELHKIMKEQYNHIKNTVLKPITFAVGMKRCHGCGEFFESGFYLDTLFYCKKCTVKDFKNFIEIRKECE